MNRHNLSGLEFGLWKITAAMLLVFHFCGCSQLNLLSTGRDLAKVAWDLPHHNNFVYQNRNSLGDDFFRLAESTLNNGYLYIVLSSTGSPASNLINTFTGQEYAHTSLSFDEELKTVVSYNGGNGVNAPGMNKEEMEFFNQKEDAKIMIYKLTANEEQKRKVLQKVREINKQGSSYNILGLFFPLPMRDNVMYCSQFVYQLLVVAELDYFQIAPDRVRPIDFVRLDDQGMLEFYQTIFLKDLKNIY